MRENLTLHPPYDLSEEALQILSYEIRRGVFQTCLKAGSGHIGGASSSVELMTVLYFGGILRYDPENPSHPIRDRVLVRGHLSSLRYKIFSLIGYIAEEELEGYRELRSRLQGHEDHQLVPGIDISPSGSLGMLLSYGVGTAIAANDLGEEFKIFVFLGDGEEQEGNVSESARHAAYLGLNNIVIIMDRNQKQLADPISETDSSDLIRIWSGYGWEILQIDNGHDIENIKIIYQKAIHRNRPVLIIANTIKGYGLSDAEDHFNGYHTLYDCPKNAVEDGIEKLNNLIRKRDSQIEAIRQLIYKHQKTEKIIKKQFQPVIIQVDPNDNPTQDIHKVFRRNIKFEHMPYTEPTTTSLEHSQIEYFRRLKDTLASNAHSPFPIYFLTADITPKDNVNLMNLRTFTRYFNVGIREQHVVAMAHGLSTTNPTARVIINSFDAFTYRSLDQLNAIDQGGGSVIIISNAAGLTSARNGKTHQTAGQPLAILSIPGATFLEPGDVKDLYNCLNWAIGKSRGIVFIRVHRSNVESYQIPERNIEYYIVHRSEVPPELSIIASGLTVKYSIEAAITLQQKHIPTQVINIINHRSVSNEHFVSLFPPNKPILTVYNGLPEVLQNNVAHAIMRYARDFPSRIIGHGFSYGTSGRLKDIVAHYKLDADGIVRFFEDNF